MSKRVVGSDGDVAVLASQFPLTFADDKLVPAFLVFCRPELTSQTEVGVGDGVVAVTAARSAAGALAAADPLVRAVRRGVNGGPAAVTPTGTSPPWKLTTRAQAA